MPRKRVWLRAGLVLLVAGLGGCGTRNLDLLGNVDWSAGDWQCYSPGVWQVQGFDDSHFSAPAPGEQLAASVHRGEVVALELRNGLSTSCGSSVTSVQWRSTAPEVATVVARVPLGAELRAIAPGEARVSADVALADGSRQTAELYAFPKFSIMWVRVYSVRVVQ